MPSGFLTITSQLDSTPTSITSAAMKITHPEALWKKPCASSGFYSVRTPVIDTREAFASIAMGTVEKNSATRIQVFFSRK